MSWQWWTAQGFGLVGLIFAIVSYQQRTTIKLMWSKSISTLCVFAGFVFLGNVPAMIMNGAGVLRNGVAMFFAYKPSTDRKYKLVGGGVIIALLIVLNIVFWKNYYSLYSMILGALFVITYFQSTSARIRHLSVISETAAVVYYSLLLSPMNIAIEAFGLISSAVGIVRVDIPDVVIEREMNEEIEKGQDDEWE